MYLISIYFDEKTNRKLGRYMNQIAKETGNTFMIDHHVPPHMTLLSIEAKNVEILVPAFESLQETLKTGEIHFVSVGQMLPYVMYVTPVLNEYLLNMSKTFFEIYCKIPETSISKYYQPFSWLPHVTLGKTLDKEQMRKAFTILQDSFAPFRATVTEIGLSSVNPHRDVMRFELHKQ